MAALINSPIMRIIPLIIAVCLVGVAASAGTSTYVFVPEQSTVVRTGGIVGVPRTYTIKGKLQLAVDPNAGSASFTHVDANATDDSQFKHTLDLNHVFNMTSLVGTVVDNATLKFTGKAPDDSDVNITVTLQDGSAHLIGQTTPPPNSADFFIFNLDAVAQRKYGGGSGTSRTTRTRSLRPADLIALGETPDDYDKHFILTADIDLDPNLPAVRSSTRPSSLRILTMPRGISGHSFHRRLRRQWPHDLASDDHRSKDYPWACSAANYGYDVLDRGTEVKNLGVVDVNITGSGDYVGGLVGDNTYGTVTHCYSTGAVSGPVGVSAGWWGATAVM